MRTAAQDATRHLEILSIATERILVEVDGDAYLFLLPQAYIELTPGRILKRVRNWPRLKGRKIKGHIILATRADLSSTVVASDGANLPPRVAAIGLWGRVNHVAAARSDKRMADLLELAGVPRAEIRRSLRKAPQKLTKSIKATAGTTENLNSGSSQINWIRQPYRGMQLDSYHLEERLGRGHSAEVWKCTVSKGIQGVPLEVGQPVAVKIYSPSLLQGFQPIRIQREFTIAADITHENLARVYDLVISPSRPFHTFMVMELVHGPTLKEYISNSGKLNEWQIARIGRQLFSALAELHSLGAIHRDVKAANLMVSKQSADDIVIKLVDLGIVAVTADDRFTAGSVFMGSKHSAPLEQLTGSELDERADIYGAGSVLFHCLQGVPMYSGLGPEGAIVRQMISSPVKLMPPINASASAVNLIEFVNRCIEVDRANRFASVRDCLRQLSVIESLLAP